MQRKVVGGMPRKPKKPCGYQGCNKLVEDTYCDEHRKIMNREYNQLRRDPACNKRYGSEWRRIRDRYIKSHPICEECERVGRLTTASKVHHIKPLSVGGTNDQYNLMALCHSCHMKLHGEIKKDK